MTNLKNTNLKLDGCARCSTCQTVRPSTEFYGDRTRSTGLSSRCKACESKRTTNRTMIRQLVAVVEVNPHYAALLLLRTDNRERLAA